MRYIYSICFFLFTILSLSQEVVAEKELDVEKQTVDFAFSPGLILQHQLFGELNIIVGNVTVENGKISVIGITGVRVGVESNFKSGDDFIFAPKVGLEVSATVFSVRLSAANYFKDKDSELRIIPEVGISMYGFVNLTYGYGITLNSGDISKLSHHRVSLTFNFNKRLVREAFP